MLVLFRSRLWTAGFASAANIKPFFSNRCWFSIEPLIYNNLQTNLKLFSSSKYREAFFFNYIVGLSLNYSIGNNKFIDDNQVHIFTCQKPFCQKVDISYLAVVVLKSLYNITFLV